MYPTLREPSSPFRVAAKGDSGAPQDFPPSSERLSSTVPSAESLLLPTR